MNATNSDGASLLRRALVPVASAEDARTTCAALAAYEPDAVAVLHVVEKDEGVPDKTPVEQSEAVADAAFAAARETFPDATTHTAYAHDVVEAIFETGRELDASVIVFRPREAGRMTRFLGGDRTLRLTTEADRPVVTLPEPADVPPGGDSA